MILSNSTHVSTETVYETRSPSLALMRLNPGSKSSATDKETNGPLGPFCSRIVTIRTDSLFPGVIGELISALLSVVHIGRDDLRLYAALEAFVLLPSCLTVGSRTFNVDPITRHSGVVCKKRRAETFSAVVTRSLSARGYHRHWLCGYVMSRCVCNKKRAAFARGYPQLIPLVLLPRCVTPPTLSRSAARAYR